MAELMVLARIILGRLGHCVLSIYDHADEGRIKHCDHCRLGDGRNAPEDGAEDDARHHHGNDTIPHGPQELAQTGPLLPGDVEFLGLPVDEKDDSDRSDNGWNESGHKHGPNRLIGHARQDDHEDARGDEDSHGGRCADDGDGLTLAVTRSLHGTDQ